MAQGSDIRAQWTEIESRIRSDSTSGYDLEWGRLREQFYDEVGEIEVPAADVQRLTTLRARYKGERAFIVGNGPSLNRTPLSLLKDEYTFGVNRIYLLYGRIDWKPTFYTALDWRVVPDIAREINALTGSTFFFEERFRGLLREGPDVYYYTHTSGPGIPREEQSFAYDVTKGVRGAGSVVGTAIQLAYYMGFDPIYLIGCDLGYKVPETVRQEGDDRFGTGVRLYLTSTQDDDPNHFDPSYFGKQRRWHDPNVKRMVTGHQQCRLAIEGRGRRIFNATIGGELEVYERRDFCDLFGPRGGGVADHDQVAVDDAAGGQGEEGVVLVGPVARDRKASLNECEAIWRLSGLGGPERVLVDVGAHHGSSLERFAEAGWEVVACEPDAANRATLAKRFAKRRNVKIDPQAVSNERATAAAFFSSDESSGISSLRAYHGSHRETDTVTVTTVSELIEVYRLSRIDFLKIDAEGSDWNVLKGVPWDQIAPAVIACEFANARATEFGYTHRDMADYLGEKGYAVYLSEWYPVVRYGIRHDWRRLIRYPTPLAAEDAWGNILAFRHDPGEEAITGAFVASLEVGRSAIARAEGAERPPNGTESMNAGAVGRHADARTEQTPIPIPPSAGLRAPKSSSLYERFYVWAKARNPLVFFAGRLAMWGGRKVSEYPAWTAAYLALVVGLIAVGFWPTVEPYRGLFWVGAGLLVVAGMIVVAMGYAGFMIKDSAHESQLQHDSVRRRLAPMERTLRVEQTAIAELRSAQEQTRATAAAEIAELQARLEAEIEKLESVTADVSESALSFDIVSALRQLHRLWEAHDGPGRPDTEEETEHGHAVLMALLVEEEQKTPGVLKGKTLIEVGSTRERDPRQGSTEKLAIFSGMLDMRFITVDVDPINTKRARRVVDLLSPGAKAITEKGEDYLANCDEPFDYVYLDAFDFDHGQHSAERQARYREVLKTEIKDEACWQMHQLCAAAIATKMPEGGIVVIDDTWRDDAGDFDGKGKLAVPLLLASGFAVVAQAPTTVGLKRMTRMGPKQTQVS